MSAGSILFIEVGRELIGCVVWVRKSLDLRVIFHRTSNPAKRPFRLGPSEGH